MMRPAEPAPQYEAVPAPGASPSPPSSSSTVPYEGGPQLSDVPVELVEPPAMEGSGSGGAAMTPARAPAPPRRSRRSTAGQAPERINISLEMQSSMSYKSCFETPASSVSAARLQRQRAGVGGGVLGHGLRHPRAGTDTAEDRSRRTNNNQLRCH